MQDNPQLILERQYSDIFAQRLSQPAIDRWEAGRSAHRFAAYKDKQLVVFSLFYGEPQTKRVLTCTEVGLSIDNGLSSVWSDGEGHKIEVGHTPVEVAPSVFLWHVFHSSVSYLPHKGNFEVKLPLAYRSAHNVHKHAVDGVTYILERAVFDSTFPGV
jgi:hypothetical protein